MFIGLYLKGNIYIYLFIWKILSRTKAAEDPKKKGATPAQDKNKKKVREVEDFIAERDYTGAIAYLEVFIIFLLTKKCSLYIHFFSFVDKVKKKSKILIFG